MVMMRQVTYFERIIWEVVVGFAGFVEHRWLTMQFLFRRRLVPQALIWEVRRKSRASGPEPSAQGPYFAANHSITANLEVWFAASLPIMLTPKLSVQHSCHMLALTLVPDSVLVSYPFVH